MKVLLIKQEQEPGLASTIVVVLQEHTLNFWTVVKCETWKKKEIKPPTLNFASKQVPVTSPLPNKVDRCFC